jgi:hypothetical protein
MVLELQAHMGDASDVGPIWCSANRPAKQLAPPSGLRQMEPAPPAGVSERRRSATLPYCFSAAAKPARHQHGQRPCYDRSGSVCAIKCSCIHASRVVLRHLTKTQNKKQNKKNKPNTMA